MLISESGTVDIPEGFSTIDIDAPGDLDLVFSTHADANCFIRLIRAGRINVKASIASRAALFFWNDSDGSIDVNETYDVTGQGDLSIAYGECNAGECRRKVEIRLLEDHTRAALSSSSLVSGKKDYRIKVVNMAKDTRGQIDNYAVVLESGRLTIDAVGQIKSGAKRSESHQTSRALSFAAGQATTILPELLIDENDVKASHAMSIGRMDEAQLYYMMSRGLDISDCTMLVSLGYLMPIVEHIGNKELKERLKDELERKIREVCSM